MALAAERVFFNAVVVAEGVRQASQAAALATWAYQSGAPAVTYVTALSDADVAYLTAVNTARNTSDLNMGTVGNSGPIPWANWATIVK
jgi:hypothetical protein